MHREESAETSADGKAFSSSDLAKTELSLMTVACQHQGMCRKYKHFEALKAALEGFHAGRESGKLLFI